MLFIERIKEVPADNRTGLSTLPIKSINALIAFAANEVAQNTDIEELLAWYKEDLEQKFLAMSVPELEAMFYHYSFDLSEILKIIDTHK